MTETKIFWRVVVPAAGPGIASGTILTFARALGEYGATSMLAVTDLGLADAVVKALAAEHREYEAVSADLGEKLKKERERKAEQQRHTQNKRFGKRRKKA